MRSGRRPAPKKIAPAKVFSAPIGKNSPSPIIRLANGAPYKAAAPVRPIRRRMR